MFVTSHSGQSLQSKRQLDGIQLLAQEYYSRVDAWQQGGYFPLFTSHYHGSQHVMVITINYISIIKPAVTDFLWPFWGSRNKL